MNDRKPPGVEQTRPAILVTFGASTVKGTNDGLAVRSSADAFAQELRAALRDELGSQPQRPQPQQGELTVEVRFEPALKGIHVSGATLEVERVILDIAWLVRQRGTWAHYESGVTQHEGTREEIPTVDQHEEQ